MQTLLKIRSLFNLVQGVYDANDDNTVKAFDMWVDERTSRVTHLSIRNSPYFEFLTIHQHYHNHDRS